jgi:hypothetical protein
MNGGMNEYYIEKVNKIANYNQIAYHMLKVVQLQLNID